MDLEQQFNRILSDPESMNTIMRLAQSLGSSTAEGQPESGRAAGPGPEQMLGMLQKVQEAGQQDPRLQGLVQALKPFVTPEHCRRLERAIQLSGLAKLSQLALQEFDLK